MNTNKIFGIVNMGNTCFMNSILQILFNVKPLTDTLLEISSEHPIIQQYQKILKYWKHNESSKVVKLQNFCKSIYTNTHLIHGQQQDAHEFLYILLDTIHEQIKQNVIITSTNNNNNDNALLCEKEWKKFCKDNYSIIIPTFYGQIRTEKECNCSYKSIIREQVCGLSLDVQAKSMTNALDQYFSNSVISDYKCEKCKKVQDIVKKKVLEILPEYMIIQLNRFMGFNHKNNGIFGFSPFININDYVEPEFKEDGIKYELCGIICHYGSMHSGHYNVILKHSDNKWYYADDEIIEQLNTTITENIVRNAYLLIYKKN
jgi:ubiquitin C-terminal hydrolase